MTYNGEQIGKGILLGGMAIGVSIGIYSISSCTQQESVANIQHDRQVERNEAKLQAQNPGCYLLEYSHQTGRENQGYFQCPTGIKLIVVK
jgi:hypothetical protein